MSCGHPSEEIAMADMSGRALNHRTKGPRHAESIQPKAGARKSLQMATSTFYGGFKASNNAGLTASRIFFVLLPQASDSKPSILLLQRVRSSAAFRVVCSSKKTEKTFKIGYSSPVMTEGRSGGKEQ